MVVFAATILEKWLRFVCVESWILAKAKSALRNASTAAALVLPTVKTLGLGQIHKLVKNSISLVGEQLVTRSTAMERSLDLEQAVLVLHELPCSETGSNHLLCPLLVILVLVGVVAVRP